MFLNSIFRLVFSEENTSDVINRILGMFDYCVMVSLIYFWYLYLSYYRHQRWQRAFLFLYENIYSHVRLAVPGHTILSIYLKIGTNSQLDPFQNFLLDSSEKRFFQTFGGHLFWWVHWKHQEKIGLFKSNLDITKWK